MNGASRAAEDVRSIVPRGTRRPARSASTPAAPRRRARRDDALLEIRLRGDFGEHWLQRAARDWGATAKLHVCRPLGNAPDRLIRLVQLAAAPSRIPEILQFLRSEVQDEVVTVSRMGKDRLLVWTCGPTPQLCRHVFEVGGVCTTCPYLPAAEERKDVHGLIVSRAPTPRGAFRGGPDGSVLLRIGRYEGPPDLTPRQSEALRTAFRLGYFAHPRRADLGAVARALGRGRSATMELLRRAVLKLAEDHLEHSAPVSGLA